MLKETRETAGTTISLMYCCFVLPNSKEGRSMEPRQLRLPGFTRFRPGFVRSKCRRIGLRQHEPLRPVGQRILVAVGTVEQQHTLVRSDEPLAFRVPPRRKDGAAFGTKQEAVVVRGILDSFEDGVLRNGERSAATLADCPQDQEIADRLGHPDPRRDSRWIFPALGELLSSLERSNHRRAALG